MSPHLRAIHFDPPSSLSFPVVTPRRIPPGSFKPYPPALDTETPISALPALKPNPFGLPLPEPFFSSLLNTGLTRSPRGAKNSVFHSSTTYLTRRW